MCSPTLLPRVPQAPWVQVPAAGQATRVAVEEEQLSAFESPHVGRDATAQSSADATYHPSFGAIHWSWNTALVGG